MHAQKHQPSISVGWPQAQMMSMADRHSATLERQPNALTTQDVHTKRRHALKLFVAILSRRACSDMTGHTM